MPIKIKQLHKKPSLYKNKRQVISDSQKRPKTNVSLSAQILKVIYNHSSRMKSYTIIYL